MTTQNKSVIFDLIRLDPNEKNLQTPRLQRHADSQELDKKNNSKCPACSIWGPVADLVHLLLGVGLFLAASLSTPAALSSVKLDIDASAKTWTGLHCCFGSWFNSPTNAPILQNGERGGRVEVLTGVHTLLGTGNDGDCLDSKELTNSAYHFLQVVPRWLVDGKASVSELVLTAAVPNITIFCKGIFRPDRIVFPRPDSNLTLTICAGPSYRTILDPSGRDFANISFDTENYHSVRVEYLQSASQSDQPQSFAGPKVTFACADDCLISGTVIADGALGINGGDGGSGGDVLIGACGYAGTMDLTISALGGDASSGFYPKADAGKGGSGGGIMVRNQTQTSTNVDFLRLSAFGGSGGKSLRADYMPYTTKGNLLEQFGMPLHYHGDAGNGGDGGVVVVDYTGPLKALSSCLVQGGAGGETSYLAGEDLDAVCAGGAAGFYRGPDLTGHLVRGPGPGGRYYDAKGGFLAFGPQGSTDPVNESPPSFRIPPEDDRPWTFVIYGAGGAVGAGANANVTYWMSKSLNQWEQDDFLTYAGINVVALYNKISNAPDDHWRMIPTRAAGGLMGGYSRIRILGDADERQITCVPFEVNAWGQYSSPTQGKNTFTESLAQAYAFAAEAWSVIGRAGMYGSSGDFPAKRYALVLAGHGNTTKLFDYNSPAGPVTLDQVQGLFSDLPTIDLVISCCCFSQSIEIANEIAPHARWLVGPQYYDNAAALWPERWLPDFRAVPELETEALAYQVARGANGAQLNKLYSSHSVIDLSRIANINASLRALAEAASASTQRSDELALARCWANSYQVGEPDNRDLLSFLEHLAFSSGLSEPFALASTNAYLQVASLLGKAALPAGIYPFYGGLNVYMPPKAPYDRKYMANSVFWQQTKWNLLLAKLARGMSGPSSGQFAPSDIKLHHSAQGDGALVGLSVPLINESPDEVWIVGLASLDNTNLFTYPLAGPVLLYSGTSLDYPFGLHANNDSRLQATIRIEYRVGLSTNILLRNVVVDLPYTPPSFRLRPRLALGNNLEIGANTKPGTSYILESSHDLAHWVTATMFTADSDVHFYRQSITPGVAGQFFRLREQSLPGR